MHEYDIPGGLTSVTFRGVLDGGDSFAQEPPLTADLVSVHEPAPKPKASPAPRPRVDRVKLKASRKRGRKGRAQ